MIFTRFAIVTMERVLFFARCVCVCVCVTPPAHFNSRREEMAKKNADGFSRVCALS